MGFGGVASMNTVLKNNRNLLSNSKRDKFKNSIGRSNKKEKTKLVDLPRARRHQLRAIKAKMMSQRRIRAVKVGVVFSVVFGGLIALFLYWVF
ncbi:MAG: hypothetical protein HRT67_03120 [Flavobacteriaceae bacterium]|nr:hypothetical protein [Flavobacteriaceae bacterium]